jgi:major membrane immunogen (membrane-anchored lipoprotein)
MKKLILFAFVSLSVLSSCSSDDAVNVSEEKLTKKWYYKSYQSNGNTEAYEHLPCGKDYMQFLADGTYVEYYVNDCDPIDDGSSTGNWVLDGNTVFVTIDGDAFDGKITKLSATDLQITVMADYDGDGEDEKVKVNFKSN